LAEEQTRGLYSFDGGVLSVELEDLHKCVARVESERAAKAMQLSWSVMLMFDALVNLVVFPIRDIREHLKSAQDVLMATALILECLWEEHADEWLGPDLPRGRGKSIGGDIDVDDEGSEQNFEPLQLLRHCSVGYQSVQPKLTSPRRLIPASSIENIRKNEEDAIQIADE
jgi:hypothetical protein